jgi:uncharacterized protein (TIGR04255 family)
MWKPVHEAHAIERVRLMISFSEPITPKATAAAAEHVVSNYLDWGLDTSERATSPPQEIVLQLGPDAKPQLAGNEGFVFKKLDGNAVVEEVGFRAGRLGYVTTTYGRWETLETRAKGLFEPALDKLRDFVDVSSVKLEYWDAFVFDGDMLEGDAREVLADTELGVPPASQGPGCFWHSHGGWFGVKSRERFLVNRNVSVAPRNIASGSVMSLAVHTLVERRASDGEFAQSDVFDLLQTMHKIANTVFGECISSDMRDRIGLNLEEYVVE